MRVTTWLAAASILSLGLLAGCGATGNHTQFAPGTATSLRIESGDLTLPVGGSQTLLAIALDDKGLVVPNSAVTWSAFNQAVATVDAEGTIHAVGAGVTSVSAVVNGMTSHIQVTVTAGPVVLSFAGDIQNMTSMSCSCHQPGGTANGATGSMSDLANLTAKGYVVAGNPQGSSFLVKGSGGAGHPAGNVWGTNAQKVSDWIQQGAKP